jgi:hypothetical protein
MRLSHLVFCAALIGFFSVLGFSSAFADSLVRCESEGFQFKHCPADTHGGVQLRRQLSDTDCRRGENWGYDRRGIWVNEGCAGEFAVENRLSGNEYWGWDKRERWNNDKDEYAGGRDWPWGARGTIRCESENYNFHRCPADTRGSVQLRRQLSDTDCRRGENWGYDRHGIWVNEGCAGEFRVG